LRAWQFGARNGAVGRTRTLLEKEKEQVEEQEVIPKREGKGSEIRTHE